MSDIASEVERAVRALDWEVCVAESAHDPGCPGDSEYCVRHCPVPVQRWLTTEEVAQQIAAWVGQHVEAARREALLEAARDAANTFTDDAAKGYAIWLWNTEYAAALQDRAGDGASGGGQS